MTGWFLALVFRALFLAGFVVVYAAIHASVKYLVKGSPFLTKWLYGDFHANLAAWRADRARRREGASGGRLSAPVRRDEGL